MSRIAIIGSGIAGLGTAWLLQRRHEVTLYEREPRLGGHTHTHTIEGPGGPVTVDSGVVVHNEADYPLFCRMLRELDIPTVETDMSFAVSTRPGGLTWCSRGLNGLFAQRLNLFRPAFYALLREIDRFNRTAARFLEEPEADAWTLGTWLGRERFSAEFRENYFLPLAASVWSTSPREMLAFPAATLVRFFRNRGFLGIGTQHRWRTIPGGCSRYIEPVLRRMQDRVRTGAAVKRVERTAGEVTVRVEGQPAAYYDEVVFACHGDEVLPLLADATPVEREVFGAFRTQRNEALLHTDAGVMPATRRAWASWNHLRLAGGEGRLVVTAHMNRLQRPGTKEDWFVSLNAAGLVRADAIARSMVYHHALLAGPAVKAQSRWQEVSGRNRTHYCGAYWGYGFHEDGLRSAVRVAQRMGIEW